MRMRVPAVIKNNVPQGLGSFFLNGPAGRLEALLNQGGAGATHAALVCHPHPLFGGTVHNKVVYRAMKALNEFGFPALRFNFRGAGLSEGRHDQGRGEVDDVRAALDWLDNEFHLPVIFCGFSFGAQRLARHRPRCSCCGFDLTRYAGGCGRPHVQLPFPS